MNTLIGTAHYTSLSALVRDYGQEEATAALEEERVFIGRPDCNVAGFQKLLVRDGRYFLQVKDKTPGNQ